ncbi:MAG TPA: transcription antitermination factor NusB [Xanthomonadales bacterium]|nr:transcription antitermination factor NusB [Xanthomonadales bacterium]
MSRTESKRAGRPGSHEPQRRARRRALQALYQWRITAQDAAEIIGQFREEQDFTDVDHVLFESLVTGVIATHAELDEKLLTFLDRPAAQLDIVEQAILRIAAFELLRRTEVPARVVLDEAIDLARRFGAEQGHSFINGVLDQAARHWRAAELDPAGPETNG